MKGLKVADLRVAVQAALDESVASHEREVVRWREQEAAARKRWIAEYSDMWREALPRISRALDEGEAITPGLLPHWGTGNSILAVYNPDWTGWGNKAPREHFPEWALLNLKTVLAAISSDSVTTTDLADLGIKPATIQRALHVLGKRNLAVSA